MLSVPKLFDTIS